MADAVRTDVPGIDRYRRLSGVAAQHGSWQERLLRSRWLWTSLVLVLLYAATLAREYAIVSPDREVEGGTIPGLNGDALWAAARYALPTLVVWTLVFLAVDRWRPQRLLLWFLAVGWGASVATYLSLVVNSWAAERLSLDDNGNQLAGARAAIYIAPFVEEAFKASVLFLVAFLDRQRLTSKLSTISLAGLSAVGFAFCENIIYYARGIVYGSYAQNTGDVEAAVQQLVQLRGVWTSFGHPLFTSLTGLGVAIAVRSRSKVVRVLAPLAGYLGAALLHMVFNTVASLANEQQQRMLYFTVALPMVVVAVGHAVYQVIREGRLIRQRLADYVVMGWLPPEYPMRFTKLARRVRLVVVSLWWGNVVATFRLVRTLTELAYLRDAITRGIVDAAGLWRERELLAQVRELRAQGALDDPTGRRLYWPWRRPGKVSRWSPAAYPGPAGLGGQLPAPSPAAAPLRSSGSTYSVVDPSWGPPRG
ncbi:MAG: PrsW family intramembrane metalloprotease [Actinomycetia bacterium]|nr:PrsW family intramembrane metalloprotease [Actinomycetes bacterium]